MSHVGQSMCDKTNWVKIFYVYYWIYIQFSLVHNDWLKELRKPVNLGKVYFISYGYETAGYEVVPEYLEVRADEMLQFLESGDDPSNEYLLTFFGVLFDTGKPYFAKILCCINVNLLFLRIASKIESS